MENKHIIAIFISSIIFLVGVSLLIVYVIIPAKTTEKSTSYSSTISPSSTTDSTNSSYSSTIRPSSTTNSSYNSTIIPSTTTNSSYNSTIIPSTTYLLKNIFIKGIEPMFNSKIFNELYGNSLTINDLYNSFINLENRSITRSTDYVENRYINSVNLSWIESMSHIFICRYIAYDIYTIISQKISNNTNNLLSIYFDSTDRYDTGNGEKIGSRLLISILRSLIFNEEISNIYNISIDQYISQIMDNLSTQDSYGFRKIYTSYTDMMIYGFFKLAYNECWSDLTYKPYTIIYNELLTNDMLRKVNSSSVNSRNLLTMFVVFYGGNIPKQNSKSSYITLFNNILGHLFNSNSETVEINIAPNSFININIDNTIQNFIQYF
jgi:hypothetical protein